jgi:hypothetical protein
MGSLTFTLPIFFSEEFGLNWKKKKKKNKQTNKKIWNKLTLLEGTNQQTNQDLQPKIRWCWAGATTNRH